MTTLPRDTLDFLLTDRTHVIERNGKEAFVYLGADGRGAMQLDDGQRRTGSWTRIEGGYATQWDGGQSGEWLLEANGAGVSYRSRSGAQQLKMLGILFGNARNLPI